MDLGEVRWVDVDWISLEQVESSCEFGIEPSGSIKCWETIECTCCLSSRVELHIVR
jgi:hypothetical protein